MNLGALLADLHAQRDLVSRELSALDTAIAALAPVTGHKSPAAPALSDGEVGGLFDASGYPELSRQWNSYLQHCAEAGVPAAEVMSFEQFVRGMLAERQGDGETGRRGERSGLTITGDALHGRADGAEVFAA